MYLWVVIYLPGHQVEMRAFIENEKKRLKNYLTQRTWAGFLRKKVKCRENAKIAAAFLIRF